MSHEERLKDTFEGVEKTFSSKLQITKNEDASSSSAKTNQCQSKWQSQNYSRIPARHLAASGNTTVSSAPNWVLRTAAYPPPVWRGPLAVRSTWRGMCGA